MSWRRFLKQSIEEQLKEAEENIQYPAYFKHLMILMPVFYSSLDIETKKQISTTFHQFIKRLDTRYLEEAKIFEHHMDLTHTSPPNPNKWTKRMKGQFVLFILFALASLTVLLGYKKGRHECQIQAIQKRYQRSQLYREPFPTEVFELLHETYEQTLNTCLLTKETKIFVLQTTPQNFHFFGFLLLVMTSLLAGEAFVMQRHILVDYIGEFKTKLLLIGLAACGLYKTQQIFASEFPSEYKYVVDAIVYAKQFATVIAIFAIKDMSIKDILDIVLKLSLGVTAPLLGYRYVSNAPPRRQRLE